MVTPRHVLLVGLLVPAIALAKSAKLSVQAGNGDLQFTYDPAKISEADLREAAVFAPESSPDAVITAGLESCHDAAGKSIGCGATPHTPAQPVFFKDADLTVAENKVVVQKLADRKVAKELEPAKEWQRRMIAFYAGLEERKLAYYRSWKTADLAPPIEGVDGAKACAKITAKLDAAATPAEKYKLAQYDWHNCMNDQGHTALGEFPKAPWQAFLKAHGVKAKYVMQEGD